MGAFVHDNFGSNKERTEVNLSLLILCQYVIVSIMT